MPLFRNREAAQPADTAWNGPLPGICMYGYHAIPDGTPYITIAYSRERFDGQAVDVDDSGVLLFTCLEHAPSEEQVVQALAAAGMPV